MEDSSDNKQRYTILRKIGCDEKMINKALFRQIGIFFGVSLVLAIIHFSQLHTQVVEISLKRNNFYTEQVNGKNADIVCCWQNTENIEKQAF